MKLGGDSVFKKCTYVAQQPHTAGGSLPPLSAWVHLIETPKNLSGQKRKMCQWQNTRIWSSTAKKGEEIHAGNSPSLLILLITSLPWDVLGTQWKEQDAQWWCSSHLYFSPPCLKQNVYASFWMEMHTLIMWIVYATPLVGGRCGSSLWKQREREEL